MRPGEISKVAVTTIWPSWYRFALKDFRSGAWKAFIIRMDLEYVKRGMWAIPGTNFILYVSEYNSDYFGGGPMWRVGTSINGDLKPIDDEKFYSRKQALQWWAKYLGGFNG
jgi:hypothetical protein